MGVLPATPALLGLLAGLSDRAARRMAERHATRARARLHGDDRASTLTAADIHAVTAWLASQEVPENAHPQEGFKNRASGAVWQHRGDSAMKRRYLIVAVVAVALVGLALWLFPSPPDDYVEQPAGGTASAELLERGRVLARLANCHACHTARGGEPFAGGRAIPH